jgi:hypothetical protein
MTGKLAPPDTVTERQGLTASSLAITTSVMASIMPAVPELLLQGMGSATCCCRRISV